MVQQGGVAVEEAVGEGAVEAVEVEAGRSWVLWTTLEDQNARAVDK